MPPRPPHIRPALANALTASRGLIGLYIAVALLPDRHMVAFWCLIGASLTDLADGWVARALNATSPLGEILDPLSDKILADACWIALARVGWISGWVAGILVSRDILVVVGYAWSWRRGVRWTANLTGRITVSFEGTALAVLLFHDPWMNMHWSAIGRTLAWITVCLSACSAVQYSTKRTPASSDSPRR